MLIDHSTTWAHGWANETGTDRRDRHAHIDRISIPLHELNALPKASQRLLDDSAFDVEGWLAGRIADKFARAEASAFISGDGVDKPKGFLTTRRWTMTSGPGGTWAIVPRVPTGSAGPRR